GWLGSQPGSARPFHTGAPRYLHTPERFDSRSRPGRAVPSYRELRPEGGLAIHSWLALLAEITLKIIVSTIPGLWMPKWPATPSAFTLSTPREETNRQNNEGSEPHLRGHDLPVHIHNTRRDRLLHRG